LDRFEFGLFTNILIFLLAPDTASIYHNEAFIGKALKECGVDRNDVFITSKVVGHG